jgi:4-hydroxy-tetrahydrodipicolinate synthase
MINAFKDGDVAKARHINNRLVESFAYETGDEAPNPIPTKVMMEVLGFKVGDARLPMGPAPATQRAKAEAVLANLERARQS